MLLVESVDVDVMWNSIIDTVEEAEEEDVSDDLEPAQEKISKKVAHDLAALRVSP